MLLDACAGIAVPTLVAIALCVLMLWRWRHNKHPIPERARSVLNRTFRRHTQRQSDQSTALNVAYRSATGSKSINNDLHSRVRVAHAQWRLYFVRL